MPKHTAPLGGDPPPMIQQEGKLRVVYRDGDRCAVARWVTVHNENTYIGGPVLHLGDSRASYRRDGHVHFWGWAHERSEEQRRRLPTATRQEPLAQLRGTRALGAAAGGGTDPSMMTWRTAIRPATPGQRINLIVDLAELPQPAAIEVWAVEPGRGDLADDILAELAGRFRVAGHALMDWTQPQFLAVVWGFRPDALASPPGKVLAIARTPLDADVLVRMTHLEHGPDPSGIDVVEHRDLGVVPGTRPGDADEAPRATKHRDRRGRKRPR